MSLKKILCIVGARPNFMKIAPIMRALREQAPDVMAKLVHTGQHYDYAMNESFFQQLQIPAPDISLEVGSGSHAQQTAEIMKRFEPILDVEQPDCILVVGDVNSTIACALVAAKMGVKVLHVEAGLRSRDRSMPEEINRILTDQLSDRLYVTERDAIANLLAEGIPESKISFVGNVMIDTLMHSLPNAINAMTTIDQALSTDLIRREIFASLPAYGLLTLHRPSNVDDPKVLRSLLEVLSEISEELPIIFPVHPRTRGKIVELGQDWFLDLKTVLFLEPQGYLEMLGLTKSASLVLTDSGGLQEESTVLGVPCLTLRENTERPITIHQGTNTLVGVSPEAIRNAYAEKKEMASEKGLCPELWDGLAAERIVADIVNASC